MPINRTSHPLDRGERTEGKKKERERKREREREREREKGG